MFIYAKSTVCFHFLCLKIGYFSRWVVGWTFHTWTKKIVFNWKSYCIILRRTFVNNMYNLAFLFFCLFTNVGLLFVGCLIMILCPAPRVDYLMYVMKETMLELIISNLFIHFLFYNAEYKFPIESSVLNSTGWCKYAWIKGYKLTPEWGEITLDDFKNRTYKVWITN